MSVTVRVATVPLVLKSTTGDAGVVVGLAGISDAVAVGIQPDTAAEGPEQRGTVHEEVHPTDARRR